MSRRIFEQHVDERGNVSVRISDECVVLTHEEAELIKAKFDQLNDENAKLRELLRDMVEWAYIDSTCDLQEQFVDRMRELRVEVYS